MGSEIVPRSRYRRVSIGLAVVALVLGAAGPQAWGWYHLRAARAALAKQHPAEARPKLESALAVWPDRVAVRLLASRAARPDEDFPEADRPLRPAPHPA